jgi:hypothetical protein
VTDAPPPMTVADASRRHDLTLALSPGQLLLIVAAAFLLLRILRAMRGRTAARGFAHR